MSADFEILDVKLRERDYLTNVLNRGGLETKLGEDVLKKSCEQKSYSIILFDIDYFKAINDLLGHDQGDEVLRDVGRILKSFDSEVSRYAGLYGRWGGEEFLIALPYASEDDATSLAERVRGAVEDYAFHDVQTGKTLEEQITITLGVNTEDLESLAEYIRKDVENAVKQIVKKADTALSYGKLLGRNRVEVFSEYIAREMRNLKLTRRFYFELIKCDSVKLESALDRSRNMKNHTGLNELLVGHADVIRQHINPRDTRTQSVFADEFYRQVRKLPCEKKDKILRFMKYFIQGRYD